MKKLLVLHGPNINLLGTREPEIYGNTTLEQLNFDLCQTAESLGFTLDSFQSNAEHELIAMIHEVQVRGVDLLIINPGALTHTSIAIRDALAAINLPFIEVHISNTFNRESFRHKSYISDLSAGIIIGFGVLGYTLAIHAAKNLLNTNSNMRT